MFTRSIVISLAALAGSAFAQNKTCARSYTVQVGDICDSISAANNASTYQLSAVNPSIDMSCNDLTPGETLCLGYQGTDCKNTYVVKANDDCDIISSAYGLNTTVLYGNNPQIDAECDNLYVGEVLCVAGSDISPPIASGSVVPTAIPATATPAISSSVVPSPTAAASSSAASASATDDGDDGDDDSDIPYCDEL